MAHPLAYGEKDLAIISPTINLTTETATGFEINGNVTAPNLYGKTVATPEVVTISPLGVVGSGTAASIAGAGITFGAFGAAPNANAGVISAGGVITLEPADGTHPGGVALGAQTIPGAKTFGAAPILSTGVYGVTPSGSPQLMTINAAGALGSSATFENTYDPAPLGGASNMALNVGTITAATVRGVGISAPWPITLDLTTAGQTIFLRIPAFNISTTSGGTGTALSFSGTLAAKYRPANFVCQFIPMNSNNVVSASENYITINPTGAVTLNVQTTSWTVGFGLPFDIVVPWIAP